MIIGIDASRANAKEKTGTEWYSWHVIRQLVKLAEGHQLRLYTREPLQGGLEHLGPNVEERVLSWRPGLLWSHLRLSWELWRRPPDLLFIPADTIPLIHPAKTVTTIHDVAFERWPELYRGKSVQRRLGWLRPLIHVMVRLFTLGRYSASERDYHRWSARHALRSSQRILTVSEFSKQEIVATLSADPKKIVVTHLGVRQQGELSGLTAESIAATKARHRLVRPYCIFVGRLEEKKNIGLLLESYVTYRAMADDPVDLVLVGGAGYGWEAAIGRVPEQQKPFIHQLGWVAENDRWELQAGAQALLFLSAYEGFGLPPVESLVLGVPVLASKLASLPEVLGPNARYATVLEPQAVAADILFVTTDQSWRDQVIASGKIWVQQFTWQKTAEQTWAEFQRLLPDLVKKG